MYFAFLKQKIYSSEYSLKMSFVIFDRGLLLNFSSCK